MTDRSPLLGRLAARDALAATLGIEFVDGGAGHATVRMRVGSAHLNFHGTCHGGAIFSLADTAFGLASNSHGIAAAAIDAHLSFNTAVREGEVLTATARERSRGRRLATYGVDVTRADGRVVSVFTGTVFVSGDPLDAGA
jgi:phenylacetic acid degradation protein PaaD